jgi:O-antigen ligase
MMRWLAYGLMTVCLGGAVLLKGGVNPQQWEWSALGISIATAIWLLSGPENLRSPRNSWETSLLAALLAWMLLQLVPLPPALLHLLSPLAWNAVAAARDATGQAKGSWAALSLAPGATLERLLYVIPAMAAFFAAREMGWFWRRRIWIVVAPVIGVAFLESLLGLGQFYFARIEGLETGHVTGTYVNRNHFAGLLEMAFPLAVMAAVACWRKGASRSERQQSVLPALAAAALTGGAASLLMGVVLSLSRMGFIATLVAAGLTTFILLLSLGSTGSWWVRAFRVSALVAVPLFILILLPTGDLILRFTDIATGEVSKDIRMEIGRNTLQLISHYPLTGTGLGTYERGLYRYQTVVPMQTVNFAHNDYLQILAEMGIIGAVLAGALGLWILFRPLSVLLSAPNSPKWPLAAGLLSALLTLMIHSLVDFNLYIPANALAFAWLSGVAVSPGLQRD